MGSRAASAAAAVGLLALVSFGPAHVVAPAGADPEDEPGSSQTQPCSATWLHPGSDVLPGEHLDYLGVRQAWRFATGEGQSVAVIDTGVAPHPRLPRLRGGGDLVGDSDGLQDCDAHGTLITGLIAASEHADGFAGIAPNAEIVSIRHSSGKYSSGSQSPVTPGEVAPDGSGTVTSLARAIDAAADSGASVINISEVACVPKSTVLDDSALSAAVHNAVLERDIVIVAAAGNIDGACADSNPPFPPPNDGTAVDPMYSVVTVASPAWYDDLVLTVGSVTMDGRPSEFSLPGPWVDVAAPGEGLASLSVAAAGETGPVPDLATAVVTENDAIPIEGSSFSAPLVAGLAALLRERFPALTAPQIYERITRTATGGGHGDDWRIGAGIIDPLAALTAPSGLFRQAVADPVPVSIDNGVPDDEGQRAVGVTIAAIAATVLSLTLGGALVRAAVTRPSANRSRADSARIDR